MTTLRRVMITLAAVAALILGGTVVTTGVAGATGDTWCRC